MNIELCLAEETSFIYPLGYFFRDSAIRESAKWDSTNREDISAIRRLKGPKNLYAF